MPSNDDTILQQRLHELYDYADGNFYWKFDKSYQAKKGQKANRPGSKYQQLKFDGKTKLFHRMVFLFHKGYLPTTVDHINGDKSDNRIENLRDASYSGNNANRTAPKSNKTGVKNLFWNKYHNKWQVMLSYKGKVMYTKLFEDFELAELVAVEARAKFHGEFANYGVTK